MPTSSPAALETRGLCKNFDRPAVDHLDLTVRAGEFYALLGPNGAGKTTTLRMVTGLFLTESVSENLRLVQDRSSNVDAAFLFGGVANSKTSPDLVSLGSIHFAPIWFFYRGTETLDRLLQLRGKRIAIGPSLIRVISPILAASGVTSDTATILYVNAPKSVAALREGKVDVIILTLRIQCASHSSSSA
jgi:energy-coupling factor transporter ATP-binding protein EcfA2